jgi:hypothetical protein
MGSETATSEKAGMQDAADRVESILFGKDDDGAGGKLPKSDAVEKDDKKPKLEVVDELDTDLPDEDDADLDEDKDPDEEKDELEAIADGEELSMAEYLGIDEDRLLVADDGSLAFNAIIDGETITVPLKDLAASYQIQGHVNNKSIALEAERTEFNEQKNSVTQELQSRSQGLVKLTEMVENELVGEYNRIDWDALRVKNPNEWTAKRQEFAERAQKLKRTKSLVAEENERMAKEQIEEFQTKMATNIAAEKVKIIAANPTWADAKVLEAAQGKLRTFLNNTYGYTDKDFATVNDSRLISLIQDAQKYREGKQGVTDKKVKKIPKFRKPGARRAASSDLAKVRRSKGLRAAVKKSGGKTQDVANLLLDRM